MTRIHGPAPATNKLLKTSIHFFGKNGDCTGRKGNAASEADKALIPNKVRKKRTEAGHEKEERTERMSLSSDHVGNARGARKVRKEVIAENACVCRELLMDPSTGMR